MVIEKEDKLILLTNDDGLYAAGLKTLLEVMEEFGKVVLISTTESMSGMSQALTVKTPLRVKLLEENDSHRIYACNGTPTDSVKIAINQLLERTPDWVVSGINHGANASVSVLYSGTMAAAIEGCLYGITSVGFSLNNFSPAADFSACSKYIRIIMKMVSKESLPPGVCLNVNIPKAPKDEIKGIKVCRQAKGNWREEFEKRKDPMGKTYYWLTGVFMNHEPESTDTDEWALANNYVSVVPVSVDMTAHWYIDKLKDKIKK
ncbi:MAG: 5'/3'-nucleotidase SurE [Bacteroidetes bacterium GWE2_41_25]|nr:MAG: 5'/3'-nucleotidase SurE [Bacteroidetes bacterium GWA2_40_15]OFX91931.1 MAG: 5'/3'-nucleotidase SurE [Bacteroidetes bacterium GWE2_41_25]OFX95668.1 MAG: 5'/3'-nucleotidase SurE [Bacteroidetes bacterium GWC2_40_22]OFY57653.1 MAG: 5'/3'-nucleotidase SurE [Bacteroidetes bacterium GWF2_41_9]HAM10312.1 5'/3'-nucleotidase SurE [Bacteroidales bacterium]